MRRTPVFALLFLLADFAAADPEGQSPSPQPEPDAQRPSAGASTQAAPTAGMPNEAAWRRELDAIADLLIDGKPAEAKERAAKLLEAEDLPQDVAARARQLRDKAEAKLGSAPAQPRREIEVSGKSGKSAGTEPSFRVRLARIGSGFDRGTSGTLRVSKAGLAFVRTGQTRGDWSVGWKDLAEARTDDGLWDAPYPLVIIDRQGRKYYIARINETGRYLPGDPILSAIAEGRRKRKAPDEEPEVTEKDS